MRASTIYDRPIPDCETVLNEGFIMQLNTMKVLVTGAAGGMGRHFCLRLAEARHGHLADINEDGLASLVIEDGGKIMAIRSMSLMRTTSKMLYARHHKTLVASMVWLTTLASFEMDDRTPRSRNRGRKDDESEELQQVLT